MQICETCLYLAKQLAGRRRIARIRNDQDNAAHSLESFSKLELAWHKYRQIEDHKREHDRVYHGVDLEDTA